MHATPSQPEADNASQNAQGEPAPKKSGESSARRRARRRAFQVLYGLTFEPPTDTRKLYDIFEASPRPSAENPLPDVARDFAWSLVSGVWNSREQLDAIIERFLKNWKLSRIARVEHTVLRLSIHEMLVHADIPLKVSINEGVELAKQFGEPTSSPFVNGILDAAAKAIDNGTLTVSTPR